jgi:putative CocE/NonD family hydrolase
MSARWTLGACDVREISDLPDAAERPAGDDLPRRGTRRTRWAIGPTRVADLGFGPEAALDFLAFRGRWYDHHLQGRANGVENDPRVWLYVIGAERWIGCDTWPPPGMSPTAWFFRAGDGAGVLSPHPPTTSEAPDAYVDDPENPVPSLRGGGSFGLFGMGADQSPLEHRLLAYTSAPLARPLALIGPSRAVLVASSSAPDTDWVVKLTWVRPDGMSIVLSGGILRARYRESYARPMPLEPDRPTRFDVEMMPLSVVIPAGHRLRVTVSSSDYPAFDRNLNIGAPIGQETRGRIATNRIYHDHLHPSRIVLPAIEDRSAR